MPPALLNPNDSGLIDGLQPVNWMSPLNRDLTSRWISLPGWTGGSRFIDVANPGPNGNYGTLTDMNPVTAWGGPQGRPGGSGALEFDGSNDTVNIGTAPRPVKAFTVSVWIKVKNFPAAGNHHDGIVMDSILNALDRGWGLTLWNGNNVRFFVNVWNDNFAIFSSFTDTSNWHHLVGVYDGANVYVYVDGVRGATTATHSSVIEYLQSDGLQFGKGFTGNNNWFDGWLDDVCIFNRGLNAVEVDALRDDQKTGSRQTIRRIPRATIIVPDAVTVVGLATESDISQTTTIVATGLAGLVTESDISQAVIPQRTRTAGLVTESDIAQTATSLKEQTVGLVTESDISQAVTLQRTHTVGLVTESDISQATTFLQTRLVDLATESDDAFAISALKAAAVAITIESDIALAATVFAFAFIPVGVVKGEVFIIGVQQGELAGKK